MAIMEIPGYYYDETKKKYFKITNGGVSSPYHNNIIQAKKRRIEHDIETKTLNSGIKYTKNARTIKEVQKWRHYASPNNLQKLRLGLCKLDKLTYDFEMMRGWHYWKTLKYEDNKIWGKFKDKYFISTDGCVMNISAVDELGTVSTYARCDELKITNYYQQLTNEGFTIFEPTIEVLVTNGKFVFKYITFIASDTDMFMGFFKFERYDPKKREQDLSLNLIEYVKSIDDRRTKGELMMILGIGLMKFDSDDFHYADAEFKNNCRITSALIQDNQLILGTNRGHGYLFDFNNSGKFHKCKRFTVRKGEYLIKKIIKNDRNTFISGSTKHLFILDSNMRTSMVITHDDGVKDFDVRANSDIIIVGLKSIKVYNYNDPHSQPVTIKYFNDNITRQISLFEENYFMVNQSHNEILVVHYSDYNTFSLNLVNRGRYLVNFINLSSGVYILHWDSHGESIYEMYKI